MNFTKHKIKELNIQEKDIKVGEYYTFVENNGSFDIFKKTSNRYSFCFTDGKAHLILLAGDKYVEKLNKNFIDFVMDIK